MNRIKKRKSLILYTVTEEKMKRRIKKNEKNKKCTNSNKVQVIIN
jgi:hypothetical protein